MKKFLVIFVVILSMMTFPLFAEGTGDITNTGSNGGAISSANQNQAIVDVNDNRTFNSNSAPYLLNAYPGTGSMPAGYYFERGEWGLYFTEVSNFLKMPVEQIQLARKGSKGKVNGTRYKIINCDQKPTFIQLVNYPIRAHNEPGDEVLATVVVKGKFGWTREQFLVAAYAWSLDNNVCSDRASVLAMDLAKGVTRGLSFGSGTTGATPLGDAGIGSAMGAMIGKNTTSREAEPMFEVAFLNRGPFLAKVEENKNNDSNRNSKGPAAKIPNPPANDSSMMGYLMEMNRKQAETIQNLSKPPSININNLIPTGGNSPVSSPLPSPSALQVVQEDKCSGMPKEVIYFTNGKSNIRDQKERSKIERFAQWWKDGHTACSFQVRGNCSVLASKRLNNNLGMERAEAVTSVLKELGVNPEQIVSGGKLNTIEGTEYSQADRRVVFQEIGTASGK